MCKISKAYTFNFYFILFLKTYSSKLHCIITSLKHKGNAYPVNNVKEFFFEKSKYFHQYFVNCVQFHKWYQNNFLTGMNTLYFTILRKIMRNKNRSRHLKKMQFMVAVYFLLKIWIYKFYNSFCIPESQS